MISDSVTSHEGQADAIGRQAENKSEDTGIMSHRFMSAYKNMPRARRELLLVKLQRASDILDNIRARGVQ